MHLVELIATLFGLACVWLYVRENIWSWPTGLIQVCLYTWIFYDARLYSDFLLQIVYIVLQIYGWYHWLRGGAKSDSLPVTKLARPWWIAWIVVAAAGTIALGYLMHRYTNAALPYWDAAITSLSLVAQFLLARKILENWLFWIAVDLLAIGVYWYKGLFITTGLYSVFLVMAVMGWMAWRKTWQQERAHSREAGASFSVNSSRPIEAISS
jgi:nicotinamide mononucleotide transporter